jgi:putative ABC transport system substrate-binding protein
VSAILRRSVCPSPEPVLFWMSSRNLFGPIHGKASGMKNHRHAMGIAVLLVTLITGICPALAAGTKTPRIGFLSLTTRDSFHDAFFKGLNDLGYVEGENFILDARIANVNERRLAEAAAQLARARVDVIVARGTQATLAAKRATPRIPIIMTGSSDPVGTGLVASLARPGANVTGMSILAPDLAQKRLELLTRALPASRVGVLWNPTNPGNVNEWATTRAAAKNLGLTLVAREVRQPKEIYRAFRSLAAQKIDALVTLTDALLSSGRTEIVQLAANSRLPGMFHLRDFVEQGGLMSYGPDLHHSFYRAAFYVDRILKGGNPGTTPVEQPLKFELAINLQTAKEIGISIPSEVLSLADRVVK